MSTGAPCASNAPRFGDSVVTCPARNALEYFRCTRPTVQLCLRITDFAVTRPRPMTFGTLQSATAMFAAAPLVAKVRVPLPAAIVTVAEPAVGALAVSVPRPLRAIVVTAAPDGTFSATLSDVPVG